MPRNSVDAALVIMRVREPGETDWKVIVCETGSNMGITAPTSTVTTKCGTETRTGDPTFEVTGNAVQNAAPTSSEADYKVLKAWMIAKQLLEFQYISLADATASQAEGDGINNFGNGRFSALGAAAEVTDGQTTFLTYDWTFTGTGTLDEFEDAS